MFSITSILVWLKPLKPSWPFGLSAVIHTLVLVVGGHALVTSAEFGMEIGDGGMAGMPQPMEAEIELYEEPQDVPELEPEPSDLEMEVVEPPKPKAEPKPKKKPVPQARSVQAKQKSTAGSGSGGAYMSVNKPGYLRNPPPPYPSAAKRKGQQGLVVLQVYVNAKGTVDRLRLRRSSGYAALDSAARNTVAKWRFRAAKVGGVRVKSKVIVPVRFKLD